MNYKVIKKKKTIAAKAHMFYYLKVFKIKSYKIQFTCERKNGECQAVVFLLFLFYFYFNDDQYYYLDVALLLLFHKIGRNKMSSGLT